MNASQGVVEFVVFELLSLGVFEEILERFKHLKIGVENQLIGISRPIVKLERMPEEKRQ